MTAAKSAAAPLQVYVSGHCQVGRHDTCRGAYAGVACQCECQHRPADPEPEPPPALRSTPTRHCRTCACEDPR